MTASWLAVLLAANNPTPSLSVSADARCERSLLDVLFAELAQSGVTTTREAHESDVGALSLKCDESQIVTHLEFPASKTTIERAFVIDRASRLRVVVKLSEFVHASLERALETESRPAPRVPRGLRSAGSAESLPPEAVTVMAWQTGVSVSLLVTPQLGAAPGLALTLHRRIDAWEVGVLGEAALSFPTVATTGGRVNVTVGLASFIVARRFAVTSSFRLRAGAGPGVLALFADAKTNTPGYVSRLVGNGAFGASVCGSAEYDFLPNLHGFLGVTVTWAIPRAILRLPSQSLSLASPLISISLGVTFE